MHLLISIIIFIFLIRFILRLVFGFGRFHRHRYYRGGGWGNNYNNGYGGGTFGYGPRRGGGLFSLLALVALDRLFTRRF